MPAGEIRDVWAYNLKEEMEAIRKVILQYPYVAMDTEFPGVVARPTGNFQKQTDYAYQQLRCNVDMLKLIQLGLSFSDAHGRPPRGVSTWQFNFRFSLQEDMCAPDSIDLLQRAGINFKRFEQEGIDPLEFGELLIPSGLLFSTTPEITWIAFHSGYDFAYLLKVATCLPMEAIEANFHSLLKLYFPRIYDIKHLMLSCKNLQGGLQDVADTLHIERVGLQHQAGSDSMLTLYTFLEIRQVYFDNQLSDKFLNHLYGLAAPSDAKPAS